MEQETFKRHSFALVFAAFISGLCSIIYELLIATTASYFLGDSIKFFSLTIGIYMASMGLGTFVSQYIERDIIRRFVSVEILLAALGGVSVPALYLAYSHEGLFYFCYLFFTISIGVLIGLEIPFLTRLMEKYCALKVNIANILSFDYFGALIATISFPFLLLPFFGIYQSSLIFGLVNMSIAFLILITFKAEIGSVTKKLYGQSVLVTLGLVAMIICSASVLKQWDQSLYEDRIIHSEQSRYQRIILTKDRHDVRLYLDGNLQFSSIDEYRYHEALIHVPFAVRHKELKHVLLLGAGDGLAIREILKHHDVQNITLVDLDASVIDLANSNHYITELNQNSLDSPKVKIVIGDAFEYLKKNQNRFDLIIADLPDPNNNALARLYSKQFYEEIRRNLGGGGIFVTQATSPYFSPKAFWLIANTMKTAELGNIHPYHANVPSFGEWGFVMASEAKLNFANHDLPKGLRFLNQENFSHLFVFDSDTIAKVEEVNTLDRPILLDYYLGGWQYYR